MNSIKDSERFCPECLDYHLVEPITMSKTYEVKGESIEISARYLKCENCENIISDNELEEENFEKVYSEYRRIKGLLNPSDIISFREKYDISQRLLAKILGWSHVTLSRYESGAIQNTSHNNELVLLIDNPKNLLKLLEVNSANLTSSEYKKVKEKIKKEINKENSTFNLFSNLISKEKSIFTGFREFDLNKFVQTVKFFALNDPDLYKVKLMKYLWYSDFLNFKRYTLSINGLKYVHLPMGPVPDDYDLLISFMLKKEDVIREYIDFGYSNPAELFKPANEEFNKALFTTEELEVLSDVVNYLKGHSSKSISDLSHEEKGWFETDDRESITYEYALELSLD